MQRAAQLAEQLVAREVAERIVDQLEPVEIDHRDREPACPPRAVGKRAFKGEPVGRVGQRIVGGDMHRAAFIGGELQPLLFQPRNPTPQRLAGVGGLAVDLPTPTERGGELDDLGDRERLGETKDLVHRPRLAANAQRRDVGGIVDDDDVDLAVERTDAARGLHAVGAGRQSRGDERDRIGIAARQRRLDRGHGVETLMAVRQLKRRREIDLRRIVAEQLRRSHLRGRPRHPFGHEAAPIAIVHARLIVDDQHAHVLFSLPEPLR